MFLIGKYATLKRFQSSIFSLLDALCRGMATEFIEAICSKDAANPVKKVMPAKT